MNNPKAHVIELVRDTVRECASTEIPTFDEIRSGLGLDVKESRLPSGIDGMLKEKTILISSQIQNEERRQFTLFHEVTHYLLNKNGKLISMLHDATWNSKNEYKRQLEKFCNIGAAEFLMPSREFMRLYKEKGFNIKLIPFASNYFGSSTIATTIQLAQVAPNECITAICECGLVPNKTTPACMPLFDEKHPAPKPKLHVVYSASSPAAKNWLVRYTEIPGDHLIHKAFLEGQPLEGESYAPLRDDWKKPCKCEVLPDGNRVYGLFHLTAPPDPNQLTLIPNLK